MIENFSIAIRLLNIQNDKIANAMLAPCGLSHAQFKVLNLLFARPAFSLRQVDIEDFFQKQVFLQLFVKVDRDWRSNTGRLRHYGYDLT